MQPWRLILDPALPGPWNMAIDLALLEAYRAGEARPTLRLYDWVRPTLSLGYAQRADEVDFSACSARGIDLVRRPTGGRAVLHGAGDLTYAVVASGAEGFPDNVTGSYAMIAQALVVGLQSLGLTLQVAPGERSSGTTSACFGSATRADLMAAGRKLVGSAQLRREGGFVQHGALMITQEPRAIVEFLLARQAPKGMTNLASELGRVPEGQEVRAAVIRGFEAAFGIRFEVGELSQEERALAEGLVAQMRLE
ncbi:MAG TPA: biotin/lipoate A/B protein ligase family protein [Stenomitos sp.]